MAQVDRAMLSDLPLATTAIDRAAHLRSDAAGLAALRGSERAHVVWVHNGRVAFVDGHLSLSDGTDFDSATNLAFLGLGPDGSAYFAHHLDDSTGDEPQPPVGAVWSGLREIGPLLDSRDAGLAVTAVALDNWLRTHRRCPRCGELTVFAVGGWSRRCPADGSEHFPRTDPAVIMLVRDRRDRALLGRQSRWEAGWFSTLAGFVESGESAEAAVRREVHEECGLVVGAEPDDLCYLGSQPWPFPSSLMLGFHAWTDDSEVTVDGDEISEARWFTREELAAACESTEVRLPPRLSISRRLIERWYGSTLAGTWSRP